MPTAKFQAMRGEYFMMGVPEIMAGVKKTAIRPHFAGSVSALAAALCRSDHQLS